jgi:hypothetical protein
MSVGFYLCLNSDAIKDAYNLKKLGKQIEGVYQDCNLHDLDDKKELAYTIQYWGCKYNLLVARNATCSDLGNTVFPMNSRARARCDTVVLQCPGFIARFISRCFRRTSVAFMVGW